MRLLRATATACLFLSLSSVSMAGGFGTALSKAGDDLISTFNNAADPKVAPKVLRPQSNYNPPTPVPGGTANFSSGYSGNVNPNVTTNPLSDVFNWATEKK